VRRSKHETIHGDSETTRETSRLFINYETTHEYYSLGSLDLVKKWEKVGTSKKK